MSSSGKKGSSQLDLLLLKAESYSKFIIENQQRTQALLSTSFSSPSAQSSADDDKKNKKRNGSQSSSTTPSKKKKGNSIKEEEAQDEVKATEDAKPKFQQPPNLVGGDLMPHQVEGLQWLLSLWENGLNGILADEMGLGKTIQIISLIAHLRHHNTAGPYLIAGPLATLTNWVKEFQKWLPTCPVVLYHGDKQEREVLRQTKLQVGNQKSLNFPIVITSFELCIIDRNFLEKYTWQYIILDEGHRIKNRNCKLLKDLKTFRSVSRLLLTGTPIQNSLEELWSLLNFCSPMIFDDLEIFKSWFDFRNIGEETKIEDILDEEENNRIVTKLHEILRPFVLRRLKKETIGDLVLPKKEIVIYCGMSKLQREYYSWVLDNTIRDNLISIGIPHAKRISQINQTMNLRKVCNHPFLFGDILQHDDEEEEEDADEGDDEEGNVEEDEAVSAERARRYQELADQLVAASGKFRVLDRMLPVLHKEGHKVIIFSQMTEVLNLLEDFLVARGFKFVRFDGTTKLAERQESIDTFNSETSGVFVFLLSTRAGGLGINLTAADTAILFDSDWNPHVDSQAQDRCHRIGQSKHVIIYRLLTLHSVEIDVMKKQLSKKKLERLTIHGGDFRKAGRREGQSISLDGLRSLLKDDVDLTKKHEGKVDLSSHISDEELELVLNRRLIFSADSDQDFDGDLESSMCGIPVEGEMYDVVNSGGSEGILSTIK